MQHHNGKHRKRHGQQIAVHQHHTDIHEVKAEKGRIAAEPIDAGCDQLCAILIRDARPPAILHTENGKEKNQITEHSGDKAGKARLCRKAAPAKRYGHKLRDHNGQRSNAHQQLHRVNGRFFSPSNLPCPDAAALLRQHLGKIYAVKHCQRKKGKQGLTTI